MKNRAWRPAANYAIKVAISYGLYYTGLLQLWQRIVMRRKAVVLMYHRVLTDEERQQTGSHPAIVVDRETFAGQMALLKRRFSVLSLEQFAHHIEHKIPFPDSSCLITFDDGWRDNVTNALPILQRHELPALIFLPVNYIGCRRLFWPEALTHLLVRAVLEVRKHPERRNRLKSILAPEGLEAVLEVTDPDPRLSIIHSVRAQRPTRTAMEALVRVLAAELDLRLDDLTGIDAFMDWSDVEAMTESDIAFGGHGAEHLLLTQVTEDEVRSEVHASKEVIVGQLNERIPTFSYPNGYLTPAIANTVKTFGYRLAFITRRGFVQCDDDPFTIRRLNIHEGVTGSSPMFLARVVGLL